MELGDRKKSILKAIISDYIQTGEPIGSRTISKKCDIGLSSATIRNEMSDLEELGFLEQPHTSAGRIPSDRGYRYYVDQLMEISYPSDQETRVIKNILELATLNEIDKIIQRTTKLLSEITKYTTAVVSPSVSRGALKSIQLIRVTPTEIVAIILTDVGIIKHVLVKLPGQITSDKLLKINNMLNEKLRGLTVEEIDLSVIFSIQSEIGEYNEILNAIIPALYESLKPNSSEIYLEGATNIFQYPEYNDIDKAKSFLSLMEHKDVLMDLMYSGDSSLSVSIGNENNVDEAKECSIITTSYSIGDKDAGRIGIIGPKRMDYAKVIGTLNRLSDTLNSILKDMYDY
jgi:heat-inducible transcriptional repressor